MKKILFIAIMLSFIACETHLNDVNDETQNVVDETMTVVATRADWFYNECCEDNDNLHLFKCPAGLHFDPTLQECVYDFRYPDGSAQYVMCQVCGYKAPTKYKSTTINMFPFVGDVYSEGTVKVSYNTNGGTVTQPNTLAIGCGEQNKIIYGWVANMIGEHTFYNVTTGFVSTHFISSPFGGSCVFENVNDN